MHTTEFTLAQGTGKFKLTDRNYAIATDAAGAIVCLNAENALPVVTRWFSRRSLVSGWGSGARRSGKLL